MMYLIRTPDGKRYAKVHEKNIGKIPKHWKIFKDRNNSSYYNFNNPEKLNRRYEGVKELKIANDFREFYKPIMGIKLLFGKITKNV